MTRKQKLQEIAELLETLHHLEVQNNLKTPSIVRHYLRTILAIVNKERKDQYFKIH